MCPAAIGAPPSPSPFLKLDTSSPIGAPKGDKTQGPDKLGKAAGKENVVISRSEGGAPGSGTAKATASLTTPPKLPGDGGGISASIHRLADLSGSPMKDGLAASLMAKMLAGNGGGLSIQALRDMMAAQQKAEGGSKALPPGGGFKTIGQSAGQLANPTGESQAKAAEADQKTDEADAQQAEMVADRKKDTLDKLTELVNQVIQFLHDFQETNNDMMAAITRA